ncbi:glycosyltransferase family 4 protein [Bosea sp. Leaf344]|uniref:glycosyltransferase family 4 protein n=1 Tax=Bosea sp. Leaf344 TaxID=1736346 RepID=UPI0012E36C03|nr:glycosyltransferase family 4 protein [Bosea sp. Leaf344]
MNLRLNGMTRPAVDDELTRLGRHAERYRLFKPVVAKLRTFVGSRPRLEARLRPPALRLAVSLRPSFRIFYIATRQATRSVAGWAAWPGNVWAFGRAWFSFNRLGVGGRPVGRQIVMLVIADIRFDPRVEREARVLAAGGFQVHVIWTDPQWNGSSCTAVDWEERITFEALPMSAARFSEQFPGFLGRDMLKAAQAHEPFAFHAHDLNTALIALTAARQSGAHVVCDFHEWYSENVTWSPLRGVYRSHSRARRAAYRWLERLCFQHASDLVTVCQSIADEMSQTLGDGSRKVAVIRNIPDRTLVASRPYPSLKQQFGIPSDRFTLLWQGGIGPSRMIEPVIEALAHAPQCTFVIRGPEIETYGPGYARLAARVGASDRLILAPAVPSKDVVSAARGADAGIWTLPNLCKNFTYALPNKIFEYLSSGLPVLVAHYPEARRLVDTHRVGLIFDPYDPRSIAAAINRLAGDMALRNQCAANTSTALANMDAAVEWEKLAALYDCLPRTPESSAPEVDESAGRPVCL